MDSLGARIALWWRALGWNSLGVRIALGCGSHWGGPTPGFSPPRDAPRPNALPSPALPPLPVLSSPNGSPPNRYPRSTYRVLPASHPSQPCGYPHPPTAIPPCSPHITAIRPRAYSHIEAPPTPSFYIASSHNTNAHHNNAPTGTHVHTALNPHTTHNPRNTHLSQHTTHRTPESVIVRSCRAGDEAVRVIPHNHARRRRCMHCVVHPRILR